MVGRKATRAVLCLALLPAALAAAAPASADPPANLSDDGTGKRWRQLKDDRTDPGPDCSGLPARR
jgi:Spy/CpxP family protein refolding chaperone